MPEIKLELKTPGELLDDIVRLRKALEGIAEFCSSHASKLGAIDRLASIRNTATQALAHLSRL